jgi:hypothetical protein
MNRNLADELINLNRHVARALWTVTTTAKAPPDLSPHMIFPELSSSQERVSEQEARHLYCALVEKEASYYYYALEAPTTKTYQFKGSKPLRARTDLALYEHIDTKWTRIANIEFKAHIPPKGSIEKDIEKLIREDIVGNWFHLLQNADRETLKRLFEKLAVAIKDSIAQCTKHGYEIRERKIVFCFCVLNLRVADHPQLYLLKHFDSICSAQKCMSEARKLFDSGKSVSNVLQDLARVGWEIGRT